MEQTRHTEFSKPRPSPEKILSVRSAHRRDRKGKPHKPEFGRLVRLDEVENGIVSGYEVSAATGPTSNNGHQRSSTMSPSLAGRLGWQPPIAVTGALIMKRSPQKWESSTSSCRLEAL